MLLVYRRTDGQIVSNSGTNSYLPMGPAFDAEVQNAVNAHGGTSDDYDAFRLHDTEDAATVQAILAAGSYELVFDDGEPVDVRVWPPLTLAANPNPVTVNADVTVIATADEAHSVAETAVTFRVADIPDSEETVDVSDGQAQVVYAFTESGSYTIEAESATAYGRARIEIEVQ